MLPEDPKKGFELDKIIFGRRLLKTDVKPFMNFPSGVF
jgi:hypothetical protein